MNVYSEKLFPEALAEPFRQAYDAIPKIPQKALGMKPKKAGDAGYICLTDVGSSKGGYREPLWVSPEHRHVVSRLSAEILDHRSKAGKLLHEATHSRYMAELAPYLYYGVVDEALVEAGLLAEPADVVKGIFWSGVEKLGWDKCILRKAQQIVIACDIVFEGNSATVHVDSTADYDWIKDIVFSGDTEFLEMWLSEKSKEVDAILSAKAAALRKGAPKWLAAEDISRYVLSRYMDDLGAFDGTDLVELVRDKVISFGAKERAAAGVMPGVKGKASLAVEVSVDYEGVTCQVSSLAPEAFVYAEMLRHTRVTARTALKKALAAYKEKCNEQIGSLLNRCLQSKIYRETEELLGERATKAALTDALLYQMRRHESHDHLDPKLSYASMIRSIEFNVADSVARITAEKCREALPDSLSGFYKVARALNRKITLISGPTNSGKTHEALRRLTSAESGIYLGPLRLLALEVRDKLQTNGFPTSLMTGELTEIVPAAKYTSSTIEMLDFQKVVDVVVIDEVQMLKDRHRGSVWLQAILGAPAKEVIVLGSPEAEGVVASLAAYLGEKLVIERKDRFTPYSIDSTPIDLDKVPDGSAVIAFSRRDVLAIAERLSRQGRTPSVIYGSLAPDVRREQARRFEDGETKILVSTDAIGMGVNLRVAAVYFSGHHKFDGKNVIEVEADLVWQIAGRAGRYGLHESGKVGALTDATLAYVKQAMSTRPSPVREEFRYRMNSTIARVLSQYLQTTKLTQILTYFKGLKLGSDERFLPHVDEEEMTIARITDKYDLTIEAKLRILYAPVPMERGCAPYLFEVFVGTVANSEGRPCRIRDHAILQASKNRCTLEVAEMSVKLLTLYSWMHYRFPERFPDLAEAVMETELLNNTISGMLRKVSLK